MLWPTMDSSAVVVAGVTDEFMRDVGQLEVLSSLGWQTGLDGFP